MPLKNNQQPQLRLNGMSTRYTSENMYSFQDKSRYSKPGGTKKSMSLSKLVYSCFLVTILFVFSFSVYAQETTLSGWVINRDGKPLTGAHISIVALQKSTVTNSTGHFKMTGLVMGSYRLNISFLGYRSVEKKITLEDGKLLDLRFYHARRNGRFR